MSIWAHIFLLLTAASISACCFSSARRQFSHKADWIQTRPAPPAPGTWNSTISLPHTHLKACMCKWTLKNETHSMKKLRSGWQTNMHVLIWGWRNGHSEYEQAPEKTCMLSSVVDVWKLGLWSIFGHYALIWQEYCWSDHCIDKPHGVKCAASTAYQH